MTYWPQSTSEEILYKPDREYLILTVVPTPSTATVTLTATGFTQTSGKNEIKVLKGTSVHIKLQAATYDDYETDFTVNYTQTLHIDMNEHQYDTITISPTPADATVVLTAAGYTQVGNTITVLRTTGVNYSVSREGYESLSGGVIVNGDQTIAVALTIKNFNVTVTPTPADATVVLTCTGYTQSGNTITVPYHSTVAYSVSKEHYSTVTGSVLVPNEDVSISETLTPSNYTVTINPTPSDATVVLTATGYTQVGNSITVAYPTEISYIVSKTGHETVSNTLVPTADTTIPITLTAERDTLTIEPIPSSARVTLTSTGETQVGNSITVDYGSQVTYKVESTGYDTVEATITMYGSQTIEVNLDETDYVVTLAPTPADATVVLTSTGGQTQEGNSITVNYNDVVTYTLSKEHYQTTTESITIRAAQTIYKSLVLENHVFTVVPTPADAEVILTATGYVQSGNTITVPYGTTVGYSVSKTHYETVTGSVLMDQNKSETITLEAALYTTTIDPTPASATVNLTTSEEGVVQVGNSITTHYGNTVNYTVSQEHYVTQSGTITPESTSTISKVLVLENHTLTIAPTPSDATVTLIASGYEQVGNTITTPYGTTVTCTVAKAYYGTKVQAIQVSANETVTVTLDELPQYTITFNPVDSETQETIADATFALSSAEGSSSTSSITVHQGTVITYEIDADGYSGASGTYTVVATATVDVSMEEQTVITFNSWKDNETYYAWTVSGTTYYTKSSTPSVGDSVYNSSFEYTGLKVAAYSASTGITIESNKKFVTIVNGSSTGAYSTDGISWTSMTLPSSQSWYSVAHGNGKFVTVARDSSTGAYSTDGINWTSMNMPSSQYWRLVTYGNGKFVAIVYNSTIGAYSTDGINWTFMNMSSSQYWFSITYGNGKFVAISTGSATGAYSTDGINWISMNMPSSQSWYSVTYGNGKFVAIGYSSSTGAYSTDGITWTAMNMPSTQNWFSVTYGNGKFVAVAYGSDTGAYSTDGITWTSMTLPSSQSWYSVTYGNGKFVVVANNSTTGAYSTDGINWTSMTLPSSQSWRSVIYGG